MNLAGILRSSAVDKVAIISAYCMIILLPLLATSATLEWSGMDSAARSVVALTLAAFGMMCLQPVLAARIPYLDRIFGLDIVYVLHKAMGMTAAFTQMCALSLRIAGHEHPLAWTGPAGTGLLLVLVLSALLRRELRMSYEVWRNLHNVLFIGILMVLFADALKTTASLQNMLPKLSVLFLFLVALTAYGAHRLAGPWLRRNALFRVDRIMQEAKNVWTLTLTPPEGRERFAFQPGQFQFLTFNEGRGEEHPFTISSSPAQQGRHSSTIKGSGDFTRTIGSVKIGDLGQ